MCTHLILILPLLTYLFVIFFTLIILFNTQIFELSNCQFRCYYTFNVIDKYI